MTYVIRFARSVKKDVRRIPHTMLCRIEAVLRALQKHPTPAGCKPIAGYENIHRIRVGTYRIVYEVTHELRIITIIRIGHRKDVYQGL